MNRENCALKLVDEIILYYDARSKNIKLHILRSIIFFSENCTVNNNVEKYSTAGQAADVNMAHTHCMLDTLRLKTHTQNK